MWHILRKQEKAEQAVGGGEESGLFGWGSVAILNMITAFLTDKVSCNSSCMLFFTM